MNSIISLLQTLGTLFLLSLILPINLIIVLIFLIINFITLPFQKKIICENPKNILLTGGKMTKSLQLARSFHRAGHKVFMVETHKYWLSGHQFSNAVTKFFTVPAPEKDANGYFQGLLNIVKSENIDVVIPVSSPVASYYDSLVKPILSPHCEVFHFDAEMTKILDDKFGINPYLRFTIFLIIFLVITQEQNLRIEYVQLSFLKDVIDLSYFSHFFTILCFLLFINAFNFFDGINLQSGIYSLILSIIICIINNNLFFFYILQIFLIIFLYLNYKNKTFLGDSGTYLLSFIFAYYFIKFYNDRYIIYADEIAVLMLIPGLDLFRLFFARIINKKNPFFPDKNHIHHLLLKKFNYIWVNFILFFLIIFSYFFYKIFSIQYLSIFFIIITYFFLVYYFSKIKLK
jgi:hypothetical protein